MLTFNFWKIKKFVYFFREISENVNNLIKELEQKEGANKAVLQSVQGANSSISFNLMESFTESKSIINLKQNLAKLEQNLKNQNIIEENKNQPKPTHLIPTYNQIPNHQVFNHNNNKQNMKDFSTTDTLVDADLSFADSFRKVANFCNSIPTNQINQFLPIYNNDLPYNFEQPRLPIINKPSFIPNDQMCLNHKVINPNINIQQKNFNVATNLKNQFIEPNFSHPNQDDEDEEDEEKIIISMEDLSITTIQTSNVTSDSGEIMLQPVVIKNVQDDQFQQDLKKLDQKIFKVKQLLDSMKSA